MKPETDTRQVRNAAATFRTATATLLAGVARAIVGAIIVTALLLGVLAAAQPAYAQDASPAITASSHKVTPGEVFTAAVSFDPAGLDIGALSLTLRYDTTSLEAQSCSASGTGLCHLTSDGVRFARVDTLRIDFTTELVTIDFAVLPTAVTSEITIDLNAIATMDGERPSDPRVSSGVVETEAPQPLGGLNGEVLDADGAGVFAAQVCAVDTSGVQTCAETSGLGAFAIDGLASGEYSVTITDPSGVLGPAALDTAVSAPDVTTGLTATLSPATENEASAPETPALDDGADDTTNDTTAATTTVTTPTDPVPDDETQTDEPDPVEPAAPVVTATPALTAPPLTSLSAAAGEIVVRVVDARDAPVGGAEVCATAPVVGTQACGLTDVTGIVRLSNLAVSNYRLTAIVDPDVRFDSPEPLLVGVNPGAGVVAELMFADEDLGDPPEALAYVNPNDGPSTATTALVTTGLGIAGLTAMAWLNRRSDERQS